MSFHNTTNVKKTRRTCRCDWCSELIEKGDPSTCTSGTDGSDFYHCRYHSECWDAIIRYCKTYTCWGEELPECAMNRGGIEERGEPEEIPQ